MKEEKTSRLAFRMAPTDAAMLAALAERDGESQATVLRMLVRRAYAEHFRDKKPKRSAPGLTRFVSKEGK